MKKGQTIKEGDETNDTQKVITNFNKERENEFFMKFKKISVFLTLFMLVTSLGITAVATNATKYDANKNSQSENQKDRSQLTNEQKAKREEMKAKMENANKKWAALTEGQKEEIYSIKDKQIDIKIQMINKYLALDIIDKETADIMKARLFNMKIKMRENGKMPLFGRKH